MGSLQVIYSFMRLEVRGVLSKRKGVVREKWTVLVEEGGELKAASRFKAHL